MDYDDLFITALGQSHLFHNNGNGTFTDVTKPAGLWGPNEFCTSAAWVDYDRDGKLDLVVANYVQWTQQSDHLLHARRHAQIVLHARVVQRNVGAPLAQPGRRQVRRRDRRKPDSTIQLRRAWASPSSTTTATAGPTSCSPTTRSPTSSTSTSRTARSKRKRVAAGIAFSEDGVARAGMGVDAADYDRSGRPSLIITNFANQMLSLYHNEGNGLFVDEAPRSEVGRATLVTLGFGCFFFDYDNDGWPDIFVANGHIEDEIERVQKRVSYAEPPHLFRNLGGGKFQEVTAQMGAAFASPKWRAARLTPTSITTVRSTCW